MRRLLILVAALLLATPGLARAELASSLPPVPPALDATLQALLPEAQALMAKPGTVWTRASALRTLVREHVRGSCADLANAYWRLGLAVGLKVRRVQLSANGANSYDTHVTTEVWLPGPRIWSLSDPTFDGWWSDSLAPQGGYPISARMVQYRVRHGQADALVWHQGGSLFLPPWMYYTDIRYEFRVLDYMLFVGGTTTMMYVVDDPTSVAWDGTYLASTNVTLVPPETTVSVAKIERATPSQAVADFPTTPPPYGASLAATLDVTADQLGRGTWTIPDLDDRCGFVIVRGQGGGRWILHGGADYSLSTLNRLLHLSPVVYLGSTPLEVVSATPLASFTIEVWLGRQLPEPAD